jgi:hypothetical protein
MAAARPSGERPLAPDDEPSSVARVERIRRSDNEIELEHAVKSTVRSRFSTDRLKP